LQKNRKNATLTTKEDKSGAQKTASAAAKAALKTRWGVILPAQAELPAGTVGAASDRLR
jgi:hypothetical protein